MQKATIERIDKLIRIEATGSPKQLAQKLNLTERSVYNYINMMKKEFQAPIAYSHSKRSYIYRKKGRLILQFTDREVA